MGHAIDRIETRERPIGKRVARAVVRGLAKSLDGRIRSNPRWPIARFVRRLFDWSRSEVIVLRSASTEQPRSRHALLVTHELSSSGAPKIVFEIAAVLRSAGFGVAMISPSTGPLSPSLIDLGVTVIIDPRAFDPGARALRSLGMAADVVVCNTVVTRDAVRIVHGSAPILWYLHEVSLIEALLSQSPSLPADLALATELWCGSELSARLVRPSRPDTKVVPYGLLPLTRQSSDQDPPTDPSRIRICVFGSIELRKGQDLATAAIRLLPVHERNQVELILYGRVLETAMVTEIERLSVGLAVRFGGELAPDTYRQAMLACDVVLVSSRDDTLPLVSLDALGAGRILACTPTTGTAAYLEDGVDGFVAEAPSSIAIAAMLSHILSKRDDWTSIGDAGKRVFAASFSMARFSENILAFVGRSVATKAPS